MKIHLYIIFLFLLNLPQSSKPQIVGEWKYGGVANKKTQAEHIVECPDFIEFRSNGTYTVLNDCYGDAVKPVVETGKWNINASSQKLTLSERRFITNYHLYSPKRIVEIAIVSIDGKKLIVRYAQEKAEIYSREK